MGLSLPHDTERWPCCQYDTSRSPLNLNAGMAQITDCYNLVAPIEIRAPERQILCCAFTHNNTHIELIQRGDAIAAEPVSKCSTYRTQGDTIEKHRLFGFVPQIDAGKATHSHP